MYCSELHNVCDTLEVINVSVDDVNIYFYAHRIFLVPLVESPQGGAIIHAVFCPSPHVTLFTQTLVVLGLYCKARKLIFPRPFYIQTSN